MDAIAGYGSDGSEGSGGEGPGIQLDQKVVHRPVNAAPATMLPVSRAMVTAVDPLSSSAGPLASKKRSAAGSQQILLHNPKASEVLAPMLGPAHPYRSAGQQAGGSSTMIGAMEKTSVEDWSFNAQYHDFHSKGTAVDHAGNVVSQETQADAPSILRPQKRRLPDSAVTSSGLNNLGTTEEHGIWAPDTEGGANLTDEAAGTMTEEQTKFREEYLEQKRKRLAARENTQEEFTDQRDERKVGHLLPPRHSRDTEANEVKSIFHGKKQYDYQGRSWILPPAGHRAGADHAAFPPKKCIHRWTGHSKGVQAIEFFPGYGHLLLSGSMDGKVKVWDVLTDRKVKRTYAGHSAAVRDVTFNNDGSKFLSASYDRFVRLWDTETGQCISTFTNRKMPYTAVFYPKDNDIFLTGCSDNKIVQYDVKSGEICQQYDHHLGPVNSVLFVDDDSRIVSTSDDKKVLVWEYNIPVPIKYISEPSMHSMPATALHPSGDFWVGQSLDNQILTWSARDKFRQNRKKVFKSHVCAGYACRMSFSPNGKYLASGDGEGKMFVWDWGSTKVYRKVNAHQKGPCIDVKWHPTQNSWIASAGWDGNICLWE
jgi:pre-mRNA-processing factor 17